MNVELEEVGGGGEGVNPNDTPGFEIRDAEGTSGSFVFAPQYYPSRITQSKKQELDRHNATCVGETVNVEQVKNREYHITGIILDFERAAFRDLQDHGEEVDLISHLTGAGGKECVLKQSEIGEEQGWDPHFQERQYEFTIDLVATGRDEHEDGDNAIVTELVQ